jgi:tryptophan-rich sensory protein
MILRLIVFLAINFGALAIGGIFTGSGVPSDWYQNLNKAPWTPPGWMFGFAWTTIMICFSVYMAYLWQYQEKRNLVIMLFVIQWILNIAWSMVFFKFQLVLLGLIVILALTFLIALFFFRYLDILKYWSVLILPYFIWLLIASSLNMFIYFKN